jgi:hypothetical protein
MAESHPELKTAEGGAWTTPEMIQRGLPPVELARRRRRFELVYWRDRFGGYHYPKWQFDRAMNVRAEVTAIFAIFRTHDTMRVITWFVRPVAPGRQSLLDLIRAGRGSRAVALVREEEQRDANEPPLSRRVTAELRRRVTDWQDPTRYVIASVLTRKHVTFFDASRDGYILNEITDTCLFRRREHAAAVARALDRLKRRGSRCHAVVAVKPMARGIRLLERLRDPLSPKQCFKPRLRPRGAARSPRFVPVTPAGSRASIVDAFVFALEHREALHGMVAKARSRPAAQRILVRKCGLSAAQANAVLDLRWWQSTRAVQRELEAELRELKDLPGPKLEQAAVLIQGLREKARTERLEALERSAQILSAEESAMLEHVTAEGCGKIDA